MTASLALWSTQVQGAEGFWNVDANGNWTLATNWFAGTVPNGVGDVANFNFDITGTRTVTLDAPITLGGLVVGDTLGANNYIFAGSNVLTFDALAGNAFIEKYNGTTDTWQAPWTLNDHLNANVFAGVLDVTGASNAQVLVSSTSSDIIKNGSGTLRLNLDAAGFNGNWVANYGTLNIGGANVSNPSLGGGTSIILNGAGVAGQTVFSLNNNGAGSNGSITYANNNNVTVQGAATINVDRNYIGGANTGNTVILNNLLMNGGILGMTSGNSYALRFNGVTTLVGQTNVFSPSGTLTLAGDIVDDTNSRALIKEGGGRLVLLSASNAYDGVTAVKEGILQIGAGSLLGMGKTYVNGGVVSLANSQQLTSAFPGGLELVSQIGSSRSALPVIGNTGFVIDSSNPLGVTVPIYGMVLGIDGSFASNIDISQVGSGGDTRVSVANIGGDRTYTGTLSPASDGTIRLHSAGSTFVLSAANSLGGAASAANLMVGLSYANPIAITGATITQGTGGTVSVRADNSFTGNVTVNRGVTLNINGNVTAPLSTGTVTALGGAINTDNASAAKFGNTLFRLYGGSTLTLDNSAVTTANTDRRLLTTTTIDLTSSTLRLIGDGGAATTSSQTVGSVEYSGGSTISVDTDGTTANRLTTLTAGTLARAERGTLNLRNTANNATTFGTSTGTQKLLVTSAPTVSNGMIGSHIVLWGGANANDTGDPRFVTYDATHGIQAAAFGVTATTIAQLNTSTATTILDINGISGTNTMSANVSALAVRLRTTASSQVLANGGFTLNIGASAAAGQGAGLFIAHTANDAITHTMNVNFGAQEGLLYVGTSGGTSGLVALSGAISGSNGVTRFGDGILRLSGANTFTGALTINAGETRLNNVSAAGLVTGTGTNDINLWGGSLYFEASAQRLKNNVVFYNDARLGNVNVGSSAFNNLTVASRTDSSAPIVLDIRNQAGGNITTAYGGLILNGPAQVNVTHPLQINGGISGTGSFEKYGNERVFLAGDAATYTGTITINTGFLFSLNANSSAVPFGSGNVVVNPGGGIRLAAPTNITGGVLSVNSDSGGIASIGLSFVADPTTLPSISINSSASWKATLGIDAFGFSHDIDQSTLWGGGSYLGSLLGDTGVYTGTLTPDTGGIFRLGTGQGAIRIARPLTGAGNSAHIGLSMTGDVGRANQAVNNSGGTVQYDVPMTYGGDTIINVNGSLRLSAANATLGLGAITLNGGILQADSVVGQLRMLAPMSIANTINLTADSIIQMQNSASDFRITGTVNLGNGSTGVVRQLSVGTDQAGGAVNNAGNLYLDGGISDGVGGSGNHFIKAGPGTLMLSGVQTYTGTTTVTGGILGINSDADLASSRHIILGGGGLGIYENSFTTSRDISFNGGNGWVDVMGGLTLTQAASSTFDGPNFIMKRGMGTLILNGNNAHASMWVGDGVLQVNSQAAFGDPTRTALTDIQFGGDQTIGGANNGTRYTGGTLRINADITTQRSIAFNNNGNTSFSGGIDVTGGKTFTVMGVMAQGTENDFAFKTGAGTLIVNSNTQLSNFNTTNASNAVTTGSTVGLSAGMRVVGTGIPAGATIAAVTGATTFTLSTNATATGTASLSFVNDNTMRQFAITNGTYQFGQSAPWTNSTTTAADNTNIEFLGGTVRAVNTAANIALLNGASTTNYNYGGGGHIRFESGAGFSAEFAGDNLNRVNQGTLVLETAGGTLLGGAGNTNAGRLLVTNFNGIARASMMNNGIFVPHIITADAAGTATFVTNDATNGFIPYAGVTVSSLNGLAPSAIGDITSVQTLTGVNSIYALRTSADIGGGTLVIPSVSSRIGGGILFNGSNTISSSLVFDPANNTAPVALSGVTTAANSANVTVGSTTGLVVGMGIVGANIPAGAYITSINSATQVTISVNATGTASGNYAAYEGSLNSGEALLYVKSGENASVTGSTLAGSLTKFGSGTLTVSGGAMVSGDVSVQEGTLKLGGAGLTSRMNSEININAGATLDLNGTSVAVETIGSNNRQVAGINVGGSITNTGAAATLAMASPISSTYTGTINGSLKLLKAGAGVLTIDGFRASTPDSGNNTFTGGTDIYGVGTTGGINLDNTTFGLGGAGGSTPGDVNLYSGTLGLLFSNTTTAVNNTHGQLFSNQVVKFGAEAGNGLTVNVRGPGLINVNQGSVSTVGQGNIMQIGQLNMSNTTLSLSGGNLYRLRVAGTTTIQGSQAAFQTNSDGPSGALELAGLVTGSGTLTKLGDGGMRGIILSNPNNNYSGGTNIVGGDVQVTATSGSALGSGPVRVFSTGSLRIAGNASVDGSKLQVMSTSTALGAVVLDNNFNPTVLTGANFSSVYNNTLQIGQPYWNQVLNMATIGDGRAFLGSGIASDPVRFMAPTLGAGIADSWNPGVGVYRIVGGVTNFAFEGVNNVLTGSAFLQVGPQRNMVLGASLNTSNAIIIRNSNNYTGGTQITEGTIIVSEMGGSPIGETPLGTGDVEVYGEYRITGNLGSAWKADANGGAGGATNNIILRPGGLIRILDVANLVAGNQGRWGDTVPVDLNGGQFRYDGAPNLQSVETIGDVTVRKGGILTVARNSTASSAQLNLGNLIRATGSTLTLNYNAGFLGINNTTPDSYERLVVSQINGAAVTRGGTTVNGTGVINGGIVAPWIIDQLAHSFVGYDPTAATTGFQPLLSTATPGAGEIAFSNIVTTGGSNVSMPALTGGTATVNLTQVGFNGTAAITLQNNPVVHALRILQTSGTNNNSALNINSSGANNTITIASGGLIVGSLNSSGGSTYTTTVNPNLVFGSAGTPVEALVYVPGGANGSTTILNGQLTAAGLTKFGAAAVELRSINPNLTGAVTINVGTLVARVPVAGGGTGAAVGTVFNGQDVILNGGALQLVPQLANAAGTLTDIATNVAAAGTLGSSVFVRGDASLGNNSTAQYVRINNLTIGNDPNAPAMNGNGVISLGLQSGIWVTGTTTLSPQTRINSTQANFHQSTLAGQVTGATGVLEKFGNGAITLLNGSNDYGGGTIINGAAAASAVSTVASAVRGTGTPFGTGSITVNPGGMLRIADNANIASNAVTLKSDGLGLAGIALAHNGVLPAIITSGTPSAGQVKVESTGPFAGVIGLDYGYYSQSLNMASIPGGDWWIGNSQQAEAYYFNPELGAAASGKYLLGGGGSNSGVNFGSVLVSAGRVTLFENLFSGGTAGQVKVEVGAQTGDFAWNAPSFVNGNSGFIVMATRNTGLVGDVRVNTNTTLSIGNSFALGSGRLIVNGGNIRTDFGNVNFASGSVTLNNQVLLQGDYNAVTGGDLILRGDVAMSDVLGAGATRTFNIGAGTLAVRGVVSGAPGSNLIKAGGTSLILSGANTYQGYTQVSAGTLFFVGDVKSNVAGPLGISDSPVIMAGGNLRASGRQEFARDLIVNSSGVFDTAVHDRVLVSGGVSLASGAVLTAGSAAADVAGFRGGLLRFEGAISGAGSLIIGTTAVAPAIGGTVHMAGNANGYGINTYAGGTTLQSARLQLSGATYYTGPATNPLIISGPLGTGPITIGGGESNRGGMIEAVGGPVTIVNPFAAISTAANSTLSFGGHEALTFTRDLNISSDNSLRTRTFAVQNVYQPVTFSGNFSSSGTQGVNLLKSGAGTLVLSGINTQANLLTSDANYGSGVIIDAGILRVGADTSLGQTTSIAAGGQHLAGPADIRVRSANGVLGGTLSISAGFSTSRQLIFGTTATSGTSNVSVAGIDVAAGQTLTLTAATVRQTGSVAVSSATLLKTGLGTLALNNSANTISTLNIGGVAQLNPGSGYLSLSGGVVSTTATSGTPFVIAGGTINLNGGTLALVGGGTAQALSVPTLNYGANAAIALSQGTTSSQLTVATAFNRAGAFNSVNYGVLTLNPSALGNLGGTEKVLITTGAPANTATGGGNILTVPSIFVRQQGVNSDANFTRYDPANGLMAHSVTTVPTLAASAAANVADISTADTAAAGNVDVQAVRTTADIAAADGTTLVRIARGGLIINGSTGATISAPLLFGTGTGASLTEAIAYVREGQSGVSALTGGITARDFTKAGPGLLQIGGTANFLNTNAARLPVVSVQDGTLRFANTAALFQNSMRGTTVGDALGNFVLNVNETGVFDLNGLNVPVGGLNGNGTVRSGVAGAVSLTVKNGTGADTTFTGLISNGAGTVSLVKTQNGVLTLGGHGTYTGGTTVEAGRVTNAIGSASVLGRLEAQTVTALGTGPITLAGGWLRLNGVNQLGSALTLSEVTNAIDYLLWGGGNGYDITISSTAYSNGVLLPANMTSNLTAATVGSTVQNAGINNLTINAPMLTSTEGLIQVLGTTTFSQSNTVLRTAGGRIFFAGKIDAAGKTITKTGANDIVLTNSASGAGQNQVGLWKIYGGLVEARSTNGSSNPLGVNPTVEINSGSTSDARGLRLFTDGDGTGLGERIMTYADTNLRFGSTLGVSSNEFVSSGAGRVQTDRAFIANNSWKTVQINSIESGGALGMPYVYFVLGNNDSIWVNGPTTFTRDFAIQVDGGQGLTLNGLISGNGTFNRRSNGGTLYINADNTNGYTGGTFFTGSGRNYLGSIEGGQVTLSNTAKLGKGHVFLGAIASFQINDVGNLQTDQNIYVTGNLSWFATLSLAANLSLEQVRLRALGLGGIQNTATDYYLSASNPSSAVLALGTVYTQPLNMRAIGDGMWYLGSSTNGLGANGAYDAATLTPGLGDTFRLGAGGSTLFIGTNGNANVLSDIDASTPASLIVGAPMTVQSMAPGTGGTGTVVLMQNQNYTGSTLVNTSSTLDFRGTMTTSGFKVYGTLNVAGEAGSFINPVTDANIPVILRPGSTVRFDNTSAGAPAASATEGRWKDTTPFSLNNSVLRLQGNAAVEVTETVGPITAGAGGNRIEVVRGVIGRGTELRTPSITRTNFGTIQFLHTSITLGSDERVILTGGAPTVTNGMVAPWMLSATEQQFVTYNAETGFTPAGFDHIFGTAATLTSSVSVPTTRALFSAIATLNGADYSVYALRLDADVNLTTAGAATDSTNRLIIGSGGLIAQNGGTRTIQGGLWAGTGGTEELLIYNAAALNVGILANNTTSGQIRASSITKNGAGIFQILSEQNLFTGDIRIQQGTLQLQYTGTSATNVTSNLAGNGGSIVFQGNNTTLNLRIGDSNFTGTNFTFNKSITLADYVSVATINYDRVATISGKNLIFNNLTFGANEGDVGQVLRLMNPVNDSFTLRFTGTVTLNGRSAVAVENNYSGSASDVYFLGPVTGNGMLVKGPSDSRARNLLMQNVTTLNDYTGGTVLQGGTLQVFAKAANGAINSTTNITAGGLGLGEITLMQGTLDLRVDADIGDTTGQTATYTRAANVVTVTHTNHGFTNGQVITVVTGAETGTFTITSVANANTYTYNTASSGTIAATAHVAAGPDSQLERIRYAGSGLGGNVVMGGSAAINVDRTGLFAANNTVAFGSNKQIALNNLTIGSQILTVTGANGYSLEFGGTTTLLGNMFLNNAPELVLNGAISAAGGEVIINKVGTGTLWINSNNSTLTGPTYINAGLLDWGDRLTGNNTATLGSGDIYVNAGAGARMRAAGNLNTAQGQQMVLTSTPYSSALLRLVGSFTQAQLESFIQPRSTTSNEVTYISFEGTVNGSNLDMSLLGDGRYYLGAVGDRVYTGTGTGSLTPGLANHTNAVVGGTSTNRVYRLGHNSGNTLTINLAGTGSLSDVGGTTDVQIGSMAILGPTNWNNGFVYFQDQNTYTGQTVVSRGITLRFNTAANVAGDAGPLGGNANAPIHIYGNLRVEAGGSLRDAAGTGNFYSNILIHPTGTLTLQDIAATGANSDRWNNTTGIMLDGATLVGEALTNSDNNAETVGAITFDRGARINLSSEGTGDVFLTAASIARAAAVTGAAGTGRGTMVFAPTATASFGAAAVASTAQQQMFFTTAPTFATSAVTDMLPGYYIDATGNRFVSYGTNGVTPVADGSMVAFTSGMTAGTAVVNVTGAINLPDFNPVIYGLRTSATISSPTGATNDATITFGGSGADIGSLLLINGTDNTTVTVHPNLKFGANGTNEALMYFGAAGSGRNAAIAGNITAGGVTKFGTGTLQIVNDQSDAARGTGQGYSNGWVINEGALNLLNFGSAGNAVASNTIVINGSQSGTTTLFLRAQPADSLLNYTYTSGRIIGVDFANIDWDPGADDRVHTIADLEIQQSGGIGSATANGTQDAYLRVTMNRSRSILAAGSLTVTNNAVLNVDQAAAPSTFNAYGNNAAYLSNGMSSGMSVSQLIGTERLTKWGDGYLYIRGASSNFSGTFVIDQGAVHVTNNASMGTGAVIVNRYGVLDIGVAAFAQTNSSITYNEGSIERWSVNGARSGNLDLGKATLQIAANQPTTSATVTLNGGGVEAWIRNDDLLDAKYSGGVLRVLNPNINFTLAGDSFVGSRYYLGANGLDLGKQTHDNRPMEEYLASGSLLEIQGTISGSGKLTKAGFDTVILSGSNTYSGGTALEGGKLMIGKDDALPTTTTLTTTSNAVLDLNGQNQTVGILTNPGTPAAGVNSTSGYVTNSATTVKTLTVGNGVSDNYTYSGVIQHNVAVTKIGAGTMSLNNANTYIGKTTVETGTMALGASGSINDSAWVDVRAAAMFDFSAKIGGYTFDGILSGGGVDVAGTTFGTVSNSARFSGSIIVGDHVGLVSSAGTLRPGGSSVAADISTAGNQIGHVYTSANLTLSGGLINTSPIVPVTRLTLQLNGSTANITGLGYNSGDDVTAFIAGMPTGTQAQQDTLNGLQGNLGNHDYVNVGGMLTLNSNGRIGVANYGSYTPSFGDVFNLLDWASITPNSFNVATDLSLPTLGAGQIWDTSLFMNYGVVVVVPEPSRALFLLLGLLALGYRRRRY